ncbi:hypothetical protein DFS33DRAFT_1272112 [Desarmillaria ectypa]|nr:hypothetical protein DFS33DRAFT_1272112 [Desarmillaria ectypa]
MRSNINFYFDSNFKLTQFYMGEKTKPPPRTPLLIDREYAKAVASVIQAKMSELMPNFNHLEFNKTSSLLGFKDDSPDEWVVQTETSSAYLERLADCAAQTLNTQHGQYLFPFSLGPGGVRFFKWERSYTVVSHRRDSKTGRDGETSLATPFLKPWMHGKYRCAFVKIRVPDGDREREVNASPAIATPKGIPGLGSIKDTWRDANLPQQSEMLKTLNDAGVRNVPTFVCGGVVPD